MPRGVDVNPAKWTNKIILYDDGVYSVCWGNYEGSSSRRLGVRWNDNYPRQGNNPTWYVEYDLFHRHFILMLKSFLEEAKKVKNRPFFLNPNQTISAELSDKEIEDFLKSCQIALLEIEKEAILNLDKKSLLT
ncbi:MAG: hypothetical protein ACRCVU_02650 [Flavobacterium sp.]